MNSYNKILRDKTAASLCILITLLLLTNQVSFAQDALKRHKKDIKAGELLFETHCSACHKPLRPMSGPALKGVSKTIPGGMDWIYNWVHNSSKIIASGDKYAIQLFNKWGKAQMTDFPQLTKENIDDIIAYVNNFKEQSDAF